MSIIDIDIIPVKSNLIADAGRHKPVSVPSGSAKLDGTWILATTTNRREARIEDPVVLKAIIGRDSHIGDLQTVSDNPLLVPSGPASSATTSPDLFWIRCASSPASSSPPFLTSCSCSFWE